MVPAAEPGQGRRLARVQDKIGPRAFFQRLFQRFGHRQGLLGTGAILWGSIQALRQTRIKMLVAYSTVAQLGYLFIAFPLAKSVGGTAWNAVGYLVLSHALAKAAMFMAAGNILHVRGHDRIADLGQIVQHMPLTVGAFGLAGVSIMGLPPSGGFIAKWLLLEAALVQGQWGFVIVLILGGLMAAGYVFKVISQAFIHTTLSHESKAVPASMEWAAMLLAIGAILLGFLPQPLLSLVEIGDPFGVSEVGP